MHRLLAILALTVWVTSCLSFPGECEGDSQCPEGMFCYSELGACLTNRCLETCTEFQYCAGRTCEGMYEGVTVVKPTAPAMSTRTVTLAAQLTPKAGVKGNYPAKLAFTVHTGSMVAASGFLPLVSEGLYQAEWTAPAEGTFSFQVSFADAGLTSPPKSFSIDATPPVFSLKIVPPTRANPNSTPGELTIVDSSEGYAQAFRKDEDAVVSISSDEAAVNLSSLKLSVRGTDGEMAMAEIPVTLSSDCGQAFCATSSIPMSKLPLPAYRGSFTAVVSGQDSAGNNSIESFAEFKVTRFKWRFDLGPGEEIFASPAIGRKGTIYFGSKSDSVTGRFIALSPDGSVLLNEAKGAIVSSPAVGASPSGEDRVYFAAVSSSGLRYYTASQEKIEGVCASYTGATSDVSFAIGTSSLNSQSIETALAVLKSPGVTRLIAIRPEDSTFPCLPTPGSVEVAEYPNAIVTNGATWFFSNNLKQLSRIQIVSGAWSAIETSPLHDPAVGLGLTESLVVVSDRGGHISTFNHEGAERQVFPETNANMSPLSPFAIGAGPTVYYGSDDGRFRRRNLKSADEPLSRAMPNAGAAPLVLANGNVVAISTPGSINVTDESLKLLWAEPVTSSSVKASPNIDCTRSADGSAKPGAPGVLYVADLSGKLHAIIVDGAGLDKSAPWPRYQHDSRNTGNSQTPIEECP